MLISFYNYSCLPGPVIRFVDLSSALTRQRTCTAHPRCHRRAYELEIRASLREADAPCEKRGTEYPSKYAMWGLAEEVTSWGYALPSGDVLCDALFASEPIEWNRE